MTWERVSFDICAGHSRKKWDVLWSFLGFVFKTFETTYFKYIHSLAMHLVLIFLILFLANIALVDYKLHFVYVVIISNNLMYLTLVSIDHYFHIFLAIVCWAVILMLHRYTCIRTIIMRQLFQWYPYCCHKLVSISWETAVFCDSNLSHYTS